MEYGIQLYSVKDFMAKDVKGTLGEIAAMGYTTKKQRYLVYCYRENNKTLLEESNSFS